VGVCVYLRGEWQTDFGGEVVVREPTRRKEKKKEKKTFQA
jgi:hypothetical protein